MRPTKRGQEQYGSDLRVAPKGYEGSYNSINILTFIVLCEFGHTAH